jgi:4a-hydroxytetrahydrobiopterin dehydratase
MSSHEVGQGLEQLDGWTVEDSEGHMRLTKTFKFKGFMPGVELVNRIAKVAEAEGHHPDLLLSYGSVTVHLFTHAAGGLTENDFILAAKIDQLTKS